MITCEIYRRKIEDNAIEFRWKTDQKKSSEISNDFVHLLYFFDKYYLTIKTNSFTHSPVNTT